MKNIISLFALALLLCGASTSANAQNAMLPDRELLAREFDSNDRQLFLSPDKVFYPETWFHFIGGNVSLEGITADLEAIAGAGIQGIHLFHGQFGGKWPETGEDITCLSEKSIALGSMPVEIPDFTGGRWIKRPARPGDIFSLDAVYPEAFE